MELYKSIPALAAKNRKEWRKWLEKNHQTTKSVWLIFYNKSSMHTGIQYDEAVEEALCFGWIDSVVNKRDDESRYQFFSPRKPKSNWSRANKERVARMVQQGLMTDSGQYTVDLAKSSGTWDALTEVQDNLIPDDLKELLEQHPLAMDHFSAFPPSSKRIILEWILNARRPETRRKRIEETVSLANKNIRANHYRQ